MFKGSARFYREVKTSRVEFLPLEKITIRKKNHILGEILDVVERRRLSLSEKYGEEIQYFSVGEIGGRDIHSTVVNEKIAEALRRERRGCR